MDVINFFQGLFIGFSIAAPVGPIGILCIKRTMVFGRLSGLASGLGAASADALYGSVAAFGLTLISDFLINQQVWLRLVGGAFLCYLGIKTFTTLPVNSDAQSTRLSLIDAFGSTFFLTLTNPITILFFAAIFTGLGVVKVQGAYTSALILVIGVFLGSSLWWILLTTVVHLIRLRFRPRGLLWVNRISGLVILGFGIAAFIGAISLFGGYKGKVK